MKLNVLYEDNHIIVVIKPVGIPVQQDKSGDLDMLTAIKEYIKEKYNKPGNVYLGLVHRLDRMVGGVMVFAKTSKAASRISEYIRQKNVKKRYLAVVNGKLPISDKSIELKNYLIKNERLNIYHQDGRAYLNKAKNTYDCILIDAFKGINAPFHLATYEAVLNSKKALNDNGIIITNIVSSLKGKDSDFIKYEYATYKAVFDEVKLFRVQKNIFEEDELQNLILVGFKNKNITSNNNLEIYNTLLENEVLDFKTDKKPVTDDFCPIGV